MKSLLPMLLILAGCPRPAPGAPSGPHRIASCALAGVAQVLPTVIGCLGAPGPIDACLMGAIQPALGITFDVVACATKQAGDDAAAAEPQMRTLLAGPPPLAKLRADDFLARNGVVFEP